MVLDHDRISLVELSGDGVVDFTGQLWRAVILKVAKVRGALPKHVAGHKCTGWQGVEHETT